MDELKAALKAAKGAGGNTAVYHELGNHEASLEAYEKAQRLFESLPDNDSAVAECLSSRGLLLSEMGRVPDAIAELSEAIEIQQRRIAVTSEPDDLIALANSFQILGSISEEHREPSFDEAIRLLDAARKEHPLNRDVLRALVAVCGSRSTQLANEDVKRAIRFAQFAVKHGLALCESEPSLAEDQFRVATDSSNLGTLLARTGQYPQAVEAYRLAATKQRASDERASLVVTLGNLAKTQQVMKRYPEAAIAYREAIAVQTTLVNAAPGDLNQVNRLGGLYNNLGYVRKASNKNVQASEAYEFAIEYQRRAFNLARHVGSFRDDFSRTLYNAAQVAVANRDWEKAVAMQLDRAQLWPDDNAQRKSASEGIRAVAQRLPRDDVRRNRWLRQAEVLLADSET